jgi:hypothetical protein
MCSVVVVVAVVVVVVVVVLVVVAAAAAVYYSFKKFKDFGVISCRNSCKRSLVEICQVIRKSRGRHRYLNDLVCLHFIAETNQFKNSSLGPCGTQNLKQL